MGQFVALLFPCKFLSSAVSWSCCIRMLSTSVTFWAPSFPIKHHISVCVRRWQPCWPVFFVSLHCTGLFSGELLSRLHLQILSINSGFTNGIECILICQQIYCQPMASFWQPSPSVSFPGNWDGVKRETKWQWNWFTFSVHCNHGSQSVWNSVNFFFFLQQTTIYSRPQSQKPSALLNPNRLGFKCFSFSASLTEAHLLNNNLSIMHHCQWNLPFYVYI